LTKTAPTYFIVGAPGENNDAGAVTVLRVRKTSYVAKGARAVAAKPPGLPSGPGVGISTRLGIVIGQ
jgi:hypothetical protein